MPPAALTIDPGLVEPAVAAQMIASSFRLSFSSIGAQNA